MTLEEAIIEVYEGSDEQQDLNPYDIAGAVSLVRPETIRILNALRRACRAISTWRFNNGYRVRFRALEAVQYFNTGFISDVVAAGGTYPGKVVPLPGTVDGTGDRFVDWVLTVNGISYHVWSSDTNNLYVATEISIDITGEDFTLAQRYIHFGAGADEWNLNYDIAAIMQIVDMSNGSEVVQKDTERYSGSLAQVGDPGEFVYFGNGIMFDSAPTESKLYRVLYYRYAIVPATLAASFELPQAFHDPIVAWAKRWALERIGEVQRAMVLAQTVGDMLKSAASETNIASDYIAARLEPQ